MASAAKQSAASSTEAAEILKTERLRENERLARKKGGDEESGELVLEQVSSGWEGAEIGGVDEDEMDRRQRRLQEKLEKKESEIKSQAARLNKLRAELKALEEPMKQKVFAVRTKVEESTRTEAELVQTINNMRKSLKESEGKLKEVREQKRAQTDEFIQIMSQYESKKMERLEQIAELVGDREWFDENPRKSSAAASQNGNKSASFGGF